MTLLSPCFAIHPCLARGAGLTVWAVYIKLKGLIYLSDFKQHQCVIFFPKCANRFFNKAAQSDSIVF